MTSKEAKSILNKYRNRNYNSELKDEVELAKAIDTILPKYVELVERDTPNKPFVNILNGVREYNCGICVCMLDIPQLKELNFCPKCGQRIDWS